MPTTVLPATVMQARAIRTSAHRGLNDAIWLFGGDAQHISAQISRPAHGVMPAWGLRLDDATVKSLAVYIHDLGGGT